jgi:hypothetical protein
VTPAVLAAKSSTGAGEAWKKPARVNVKNDCLRVKTSSVKTLGRWGVAERFSFGQGKAHLMRAGAVRFETMRSIGQQRRTDLRAVPSVPCNPEQCGALSDDVRPTSGRLSVRGGIGKGLTTTRSIV